MPPHPIVKFHKAPTILLNPLQLSRKPEVAAHVMQCIANWAWVESTTGSLFVNLLNANQSAGAALYCDLASALAKDRALRSVAISALSSDEYAVLDAILKHKASLEKTRDKFAHWYWGVCQELPDALVLVDPRHLMQRRANAIEAFSKAMSASVNIDRDRIFVVRIKDLQADAKQFRELVEMLFDFANMTLETNLETRERQRLALSNDARIRSILDLSAR